LPEVVEAQVPVILRQLDTPRVGVEAQVVIGKVQERFRLFWEQITR
jgi:hypothetical protein